MRTTTIPTLLVAAALAACGGTGDGGGDDDAPAPDAAAGPDAPDPTPDATPDAPGGDVPSTDPDHPVELVVGQTFAATYSGDGHYFVFTAPGAGTYTLTYTGPEQSLPAHCDTPGDCFCNLDALPNCCMVADGAAGCSYTFGDTQDMPLDAGETVYPNVYFYPGVSGDYTIAITGPT